MKKITFLVLTLLSFIAHAQEKMMSNNGIINFEASIPLFEEVKATNNKARCVLITKTGEFTCWVTVKDFKFERSLMEQHFNSNYMESDRYSKALFKGIIEKFNLTTITSQPNSYQINGKMTLHGRSKKMSVKGTLRKVEKGIEFTSEFPLNTDDFKIEIPLLVRSKISKNVNTRIICLLK